MEYTMRPGEIALWVLKYLGIMLLYTLLDVALWRKAFPGQARWLNLLTMGLCLAGYLALLEQAGRMPKLFADMSLPDIGLALACSVGFFLLLDRGLDPLLAGVFPQSETGSAGPPAAVACCKPIAGLPAGPSGRGDPHAGRGAGRIEGKSGRDSGPSDIQRPVCGFPLYYGADSVRSGVRRGTGASLYKD